MQIKSNVSARSKASEIVRTTLPLSCKFRKNGCNAVLTLEALLHHEVDCQWRLIFCPHHAEVLFNPNPMNKNIVIDFGYPDFQSM
jgi:hypothetical protein